MVRRKKQLFRKIRTYFVNNKTALIVTFEIFWIIVFLLERLVNEDMVEIPQFIYVNF